MYHCGAEDKDVVHPSASGGIPFYCKIKIISFKYSVENAKSLQ